jgi:hypothetical protein
LGRKVDDGQHGILDYKTPVALANKHVRIRWALRVRDQHLDANAWQRHPRAASTAAATASTPMSATAAIA